MMSITSADEYEKADYKWHQDPTPLDVMINDAPLKFIVGYPHLEIESSSGPKTEFDFEEDDVDEKIKKIMPSSMAVNTINIKSTLVTKQKIVNTEKLNIDEVLQEVLQAFRENAETAERALIMATACGKLHPKQFKEYLIAFMSPHRGGKITEVGNKSMHENKDKNDATNEGEKKTENEKMPIDYLGIDHLAAKLAKTEQGLFQPSGQYYFVPAHYDQPKVLEFLSPKSSFLDMLEGADTPVASSNISKKVCSPLAENMRECPFSINDCQDSVNPNVENSVVTSGECIGNAVENRHQSLKSRTEAVRLVVATAVASVSEMANPTLAHFYSVPPVTQCVKTPDSSGHIAFQMMTTPQIVRTTIASNIDMLMLPSTSTVDKNIPRDQNDEGGPGRAVFFPRKLMMRTPPKHLPKDNVRASDPIVCTPSTALNVHVVGKACPGSGEVKHTTQEQNVASGNEVNTLEYILTNTLRVPMGNNSSMAILENVHSNSADGIPLRNDNDQWSSTELEHVAAVIRKVSADRSNLSRGMYEFTSTESDHSPRLHSTRLDSTSLRCLKATNASSDFNISSGSNKYGNQQIVSRLKKEIDQLRNQINNHTSEMAQVIAETKLLFRRLSEVRTCVRSLLFLIYKIVCLQRGKSSFYVIMFIHFLF